MGRPYPPRPRRRAAASPCDDAAVHAAPVADGTRRGYAGGPQDGVEHGGAVASSPAVTCSPGVWASSGSPGPKLAAGTPRSQKKATSVQPDLGPRRCARWPPPARPAAGGRATAVRPARRRAAPSGRRARGSGPAAHAPPTRPGRRVRSGANRWLTTTVARSGHHVGRPRRPRPRPPGAARRTRSRR